MENPIGFLVCSDTNLKYNRIELFQDSKVLIGLNDDGQIEIIQNQIRFNFAMIEHNFNSFILQSLSNNCDYKGQMMSRDELKILQENYLVRFWFGGQEWEYQLVVVKSLVSKCKDSKLTMMIQSDNCFLGDSLKCGICLEIYQSVVQTQCKHCFCGYCLSNWIKIQYKCPLCSQNITQVTHIEALDNICQQYLRKHPEKAKAIEESWLYDNESVQYLIYTVEYYNLQQQQQHYFLQCKSCQQEYQGFLCSPHQQHIQCCNKLLPIRQLNAKENAEYNLFCQVCKKYTCQYYHNTACNSFYSTLLYRWGLRMRLDYSEIVPQILLIKIQEYLKGLTVDYIINYMIDNFVKKEQFQLEGSQKRMIQDENELLFIRSPVCQNCMQEVSAQMIIKFFEINLMPQLQGKPNCPNGIHCQLLYLDNQEEHSNAYNHLCRRQV